MDAWWLRRSQDCGLERLVETTASHHRVGCNRGVETVRSQASLSLNAYLNAEYDPIAVLAQQLGRPRQRVRC